MKEKYTVVFVSILKKKMTEFIEKDLRKNGIKDLVASHGNILTLLYESDGPLPMKDIAEKIGKDKSTVTALINKLIGLGYVTRERSNIDGRVTNINLSEKGHEIETVYKEISKGLYKKAYRNFTNDEKKELVRLMKKIDDNF